MSKCRGLRVVLLLVACVWLPIGIGDASAQEITVDRGYVWMYGPNPGLLAMTLGGTHGFTFHLDRDRPALDTFGILPCSGESGCPSGVAVDLGVRWAGSIPGQATLDGTLHPHVGDVDTLSVELSGSVVLPDSGDVRTVTAPFALAGTFATASATLALGGGGTAIVYLTPNATRDGWILNRVDYSFDRALPDPWQSACENPVDPPVGPVYCPPFDVVSADSFVISGTGDFWGQFDGGHYAYREVTGDTTISARVRGQSSTRPFAKAGIMLRASSFPPSPHVILDVKPDGGVEFMTRPALVAETQFIAGGDVSASEAWLKLERRGDVFSGYISVDGTTWSPVGSIQWSAPASMLASLAVSDWDMSGREINTAMFDEIAIGSHSENLLQNGDFEQSAVPTLSPWQSDTFRQTPAYAESFQPRTGNNNAACWSPVSLDCGLYSDVRAPRTGNYTLTVYATADRNGGLVGANVNDVLAATSTVAPRGFRNYGDPYVMTFAAQEGDTIRVWMYSPATPGYVVIDDATLKVTDH
jgi:hypothetical protein